MRHLRKSRQQMTVPQCTPIQELLGHFARPPLHKVAVLIHTAGLKDCGSSAPKALRQIERELVVEMDPARSKYEQAARAILCSVKALQDSGILWPGSLLDMQNFKAQINLTYALDREAYGRYLDFLQREVPKSRPVERGPGAPL